MRRPKRRQLPQAFAVFTATVLIALTAVGAILLPDQSAEATDLGIVQIDQIFGSGTFEP